MLGSALQQLHVVVGEASVNLAVRIHLMLERALQLTCRQQFVALGFESQNTLNARKGITT